MQFCEKANNSDDGNWETTQDIEMNSKEEKTVLIDIGNAEADYFFNFFLSEGKSKLYCDGKRCGCGNSICDEQRKKLKEDSQKLMPMKSTSTTE